ncbi:MAG: FRG domain-containing protein [Lachnospiraceae bacterium]|nr:FRG domain-containing protein [Lachnospiraceae bacterium]
MEPGGWISPGAFSNHIHDITRQDIENLLKLADEEDAWSQRVKDEVEYYDKHPGEGGPIFIQQTRITNTAGTTIRFPYGDIITFRSKRHLFRGENQDFGTSIPSLNRKLNKLSKVDAELYRAIANMRINQFSRFIWKINLIPYWDATLSDINYKALAQHYGFETHLLDLTNDFKTALFFATCTYVPETDSYRPLTKKDINTSNRAQYGMIFHSPDWVIDFLNGSSFLTWSCKHEKDKRNSPYLIDSGDLDGIAFQIGFQPFMRCHHQSGYVFPMRNEVILQQNEKFEKLRFKQSEDLSQYVYEMMDGGKKVYPNEGINDALDVLRLIQSAVVFSEEDVKEVYEEVDKSVFSSFDLFSEALLKTNVAGRPIQIVPNEVEYPMDKGLLERINDRYDNVEEILKPIGGKFYTLPECREWRRQRCIQIYGREID